MQDHHFTIGKSPISGRGVFATATHRRGSLVVVMIGREISHREMLRQVAMRRIRPGDPLQVTESTYVSLADPYRLINHSCEPNCCIRGKQELIALRTIRPGEEITFDYSRTMWGEPWWKKCTCGAASCRGKIVQFFKLPRPQQDAILAARQAQDFIFRKAGIEAPT